MKFQATKEALMNALQRALRALPANPPIAALSGIHLRVNADEIVLTASNASWTIQCAIPARDRSATVLEKGSIAAPGRYLYDIVRRLDSGIVTFESDNRHVLSIRSGDSRIRLCGMDPADYPFIAVPIDDNPLKLEADSGRLGAAIRQVAGAASDSETRPVLTGVCMEYGEGSLRLTATDGIRLSSRALPVEKRGGSGIAFIVPAKNLLETAKLLDGENGPVEIEACARQFRLSTDCLRIQSSLIEGTYPSLHNVVPNRCEAEFLVDTARLTSAIERVTVLANEYVVRLAATPDRLDLSSGTAEIGEMQDAVTVDQMKGERFTIALNGKRLNDLLRCVDSSQARIGYTGRSGPLIVRPADEPDETRVAAGTTDSALFLITPVRTARDR